MVTKLKIYSHISTYIYMVPMNIECDINFMVSYISNPTIAVYFFKRKQKQ